MLIIFHFFKSIEEVKSFIQDGLVEVIGALLGFCGAYLIFRNQIIEDIKKTENQRKQIEHDKIHYLYFMLDKTVTMVETVIVWVHAMHVDMDANPTNVQKLPLISKDNLERIVNKIDQEEHYHAYVNQFNTYEISFIFSFCDTINTTINELITVSKHYNRGDYQRKLQFSNEIEKLRSLIIEYLSSTKEEPELSSVTYTTIKIAYNNLIEILKNTPEDILAIRQNFIYLLIKKLENPNQNELINQILKITNEANAQLQLIIVNNKSRSSNLKEVEAYLTIILTQLKSQLQKIKFFSDEKTKSIL